MRCSICDLENATGKKFCIRCGAALGPHCPKCGSENPAEASFCGDCGASLRTGLATDGRPSPVSAQRQRYTRLIQPKFAGTAEVPEGERKNVTALFADIKSSTELIRDLDPEQARSLVDPVLHLMIEAVHRYGGYVAQSTGDGIFALFGAPLAYEDHPQRALHTALAIQRAIREHASRFASHGGPTIEARVGVSTGEVVLRTIETGGHTEYAPIGLTANLAARLQAVAAPGSIAVSETLKRLCDGYFIFRPLGPTAVKGIAEPVEVYEVTGVGLLRSHFELSARRGLTKFVGREAELAQMDRGLKLARSGHGQLIAVVAEAGTGKSRLFYEFKATLPADCVLLEAHSVSHSRVSAWLPMLELLRGHFGIRDADDPATRREKVRAALDPELGEVLPYLLGVLEIQDTPDPLAQMDPQIRRRRTLEMIKRILLRKSLAQPLIIIFEDLHWIDSETQALLDLLVDSLANARILLLVSYRPEYRHQWGNKSNYIQLRVDPLGADGAREMLDALAGTDRMLEPIKQLIVEKTEGNPLFIEEMLQALQEQGALVEGPVGVVGRFTEVGIPTSVQGILASRIDRLPPDEKDLLQTLAVIGKELPLGLMRKVIAKPDDELERILSDLKVAEFVYERPSFPETEYTFKHALTQEVAYRSLLAGRRAAMHEQIGDAIEKLYSERLDDHLTELAHHYQLSSNAAKAIKYLELLGRQLLRRSAYAEALDALNAALGLLRKAPATRERKRQTIEVGLAAGVALTANKGYAGSEVQELGAWIRELSREFDDPKLRFKVLFLAWQFYTNGGDLPHAIQTGAQLMELAESNQVPAWTYQANFTLGLSLFWSGELVSSRAHLERVLTLYDPSGHRGRGAQDQGVISLSYLGWLSWILGYPDRALVETDRAVQLAREISHPFSLAVALLFSAIVRQLRGEPSRALELAQETVSVSKDQGFPVWTFLGTAWSGWAMTELGQVHEGIARMLQASERWEATGQRVATTHLSGLLALGHLRGGDFPRALRLIDQALDAAATTGEHYFEPELYRIKGQAASCQPSFAPAEVEASLDKAIELARRQQAKSYELRATLALARLLTSGGRAKEARERLSAIYGWFVEGFDTPDLNDARAVLAELS